MSQTGQRGNYRPRGSAMNRRTIYLTDEELDLFVQAAKQAGISFTGWIVNTLRPIAEEEVLSKK